MLQGSFLPDHCSLQVKKYMSGFSNRSKFAPTWTNGSVSLPPTVMEPAGPAHISSSTWCWTAWPKVRIHSHTRLSFSYSDQCFNSASRIYCLFILSGFILTGVKEIDIAATLEHIRDQRPGLVRTKVPSISVMVLSGHISHVVSSWSPPSPAFSLLLRTSLSSPWRPWLRRWMPS